MVHPRTLLTATLLITFGVYPAAAEDLAETVRRFDEGNLHYRQGEYRAAVDSYARAVDEGFVSGALLFNMANAYYRLDDIGQAIRYYEKAAETIPESTELRHNLTIARARTVDQFSQLPEPFWISSWQWVVRTIGPRVLFAAGIILYFGAAATIVLRIRNGQTAWLRRLLTLTSALAIVFISSGFAASIEEQKSRRAVVLADDVALRETPDGAASGVEIHEGLIVDMTGVEAEWIEIRLPNGVKGWIRAASLGVI